MDFHPIILFIQCILFQFLFNGFYVNKDVRYHLFSTTCSLIWVKHTWSLSLFNWIGLWLPGFCSLRAKMWCHLPCLFLVNWSILVKLLCFLCEQFQKSVRCFCIQHLLHLFCFVSFFSFHAWTICVKVNIFPVSEAPNSVYLYLLSIPTLGYCYSYHFL